jgi:hypothetical protein
VYDDKLDLLFKGSIGESQQQISGFKSNSVALGGSSGDEVIRTAEFNEASTHLFLGTD